MTNFHQNLKLCLGRLLTMIIVNNYVRRVWVPVEIIKAAGLRHLMIYVLVDLCLVLGEKTGYVLYIRTYVTNWVANLKLDHAISDVNDDFLGRECLSCRGNNI